MRRKIFIWALIAAILLTASCIGGGMTVPIGPPGITGDNSGGAIVTYAVYETLTKQDYYVQRISPAGDFLWGGRGVLIGSTGNGIPYSEAVSDGSGGAIVSCWECLPQVGGEPPSCQTYFAKIDSEGDVQWQWGGEGVEKESMIADGAGGVIIGVVAADTKGSLVRIDSEGNLPWGEDGVSVGPVPEYPRYPKEIANDGLGGLIIIQYSESAICAQRVDSQGNILWQAGGVQVSAEPGGSACIAGDGSGGCVIAYIRYPDGDDGDIYDIYAQRIDAEGNVLWGPDGVPIFCGYRPWFVYDPQIVADGAGGAIVFFVAEGGVYAQRIDADGHKLWNEDVPVCDCINLRIASDGSGGAFSVSWNRMAQRLDAAGRKLWGPDGITFTTRDIEDAGLAIASDGRGGVLISWSGDIKFTETTYDISDVSYYVQRIDAEGNLPWGDEGILLNP